MFLGTQNHDGVSKAIGLHWPFAIAVIAKFPHTVEYMYIGTLGMMLGAPLSPGAWLWKCMLPISLGNSIGGAVFTGAYLWWVFLWRGDDEEKGDGEAPGGTFHEEYERFRDGGD